MERTDSRTGSSPSESRPGAERARRSPVSVSARVCVAIALALGALAAAPGPASALVSTGTTDVVPVGEAAGATTDQATDATDSTSAADLAAAAKKKTCKQDSCNAHDPQVYGCDKDAITLESRVDDNQYLAVELRYSPKCGAVWTRASYLQGTCMCGAEDHYIGSLRWYSCKAADKTCFKGQYTTGGVVHNGEVKWTVMRGYDNNYSRACLFADPTQCTPAH